MEFGLIPIIVVLTYMFIEICKVIFKSKDWFNQLIPIFSGLCGGIIGIVIYFSVPEMLGVSNIWMSLEVGIVSGLGATGSNQVIKKLFGGNKKRGNNK